MFAHPSLSLLSHSFSRTDLFLVVFCLVDDWMQHRYHSSNLPRAAGPAPTTSSDSELLAIALVGELCGVARERAWLWQVRASYHTLFPHLPEDSRYSRRLQRLRHALRAFREQVLRWADAGCPLGAWTPTGSWIASHSPCAPATVSGRPTSQ